MDMAARRLADSHDRRGALRGELGRPGTIRLDDGSAIETLLVDLTRDGCRLRTAATIAPGTAFSIGIAHVGLTRARVAWHGPEGYGCEFDAPLPAGAVSAAFGGSNVEAFPNAGLFAAPSRGVRKWSPRARLLLLVAGVPALWATLGLFWFLV